MFVGVFFGCFLFGFWGGFCLLLLGISCSILVYVWAPYAFNKIFDYLSKMFYNLVTAVPSNEYMRTMSQQYVMLVRMELDFALIYLHYIIHFNYRVPDNVVISFQMSIAGPM